MNNAVNSPVHSVSAVKWSFFHAALESHSFYALMSMGNVHGMPSSRAYWLEKGPIASHAAELRIVAVQGKSSYHGL